MFKRFFKNNPRDYFWLSIDVIVFISILATLGLLTLNMIMGSDHLDMHYVAYKISRWNLLPYRDYYEFQFYGIYLYHIMIQKLMGYSDLSFRIFELLHFVFLCFSIYITLPYLIEKIEKSDIILILTIITASYYGIGWWWTGQREALLMPYLFWSFFFFKKAYYDEKIIYAFPAGVFSAIALTIKPFYGVYLPLFVVLNLLFNFPYNGNFKKRLKITVITASGFISIIVILFLYLFYLDILKEFLYNAIVIAVEFKKNASPFFWILHCIFFQYSPAASEGRINLYMIFYALQTILSFCIIIITMINRNFKSYFFVIYMFIVSVLLIFLQRNGEVINHHIPMNVFKSILTFLCIKFFVENAVSFLAKLKHLNESFQSHCNNFLKLIGTIVISIPLMYGTGYTFDFLEHSLHHDVDYFINQQYPLKIQEDIIVKFINSSSFFDKDKDEILYFGFSPYISYHTKTRSFKKFNHIAPFLWLLQSPLLYNKISEELIHDFVQNPPTLIVIRTDDTQWSTHSSFRGWKTSYEELMKYKEIKEVISKRFKKVIELKSFVVYQKLL